jgi:hypothetical protein
MMENYIHRINVFLFRFPESWDSRVSIETGYGLDNNGIRVQVPLKAIIFTSSCHPGWLWGPTSFLSNGYWGLFPWG